MKHNFQPTYLVELLKAIHFYLVALLNLVALLKAIIFIVGVIIKMIYPLFNLH
jgi:hypothetical protein